MRALSSYGCSRAVHNRTILTQRLRPWKPTAGTGDDRLAIVHGPHARNILSLQLHRQLRPGLPDGRRSCPARESAPGKDAPRTTSVDDAPDHVGSAGHVPGTRHPREARGVGSKGDQTS